ncbi:hypothetical protein [Egicoccus sp. AB-alg6-2]
MRRILGTMAVASLALLGCEGETDQPGPELGELDDTAIDPTEPPES